MMDAKTAVGLLKNYGGCIVTDQEGIIRLNSDLLIKLLEQQEKYAELGRLALTTFNNADFDHCGENYNNNCSEGCEWLKFCQKRAELLGDERDADRMSVRDIEVRCSRCDKSFDTERMLTNCEGCGRKMICDNCYEKHECEWDGE
jgi:hypothetical protein